MTLPGFGEFTCSPESVDGSLRCSSQDGRKKSRSGRGVVHASHSARRANEKEPTTTGTCGQKCSGSSASADLQRFLESRLRASVDLDGSMEFSMTWRASVTPAGRPICRLLAQGNRTSGKDCSGWPSPAVQNSDGCPNPQGNTGEHFTLQTAVALTGWPTPQVHQGPNNGDNRGKDYGGNRARTTPQNVPDLVGWATPNARDHKGAPTEATHRSDTGRLRNDQLDFQAALTASSPAWTGKRGVLDPAFSRWLMGYPATWDEASPNWDAWRSVQEKIALADSADTGMPLFHK